MRPRLLTPRKIILLLVAATIFVGLSVWISRGMPLPGSGVASTAGKLAFVSDRAGNPDIWMMNGDGTNPVAITHDAVREDQPAWSASGNELAFIGAKSEAESPQVYIADATTGRNAVVITRTSGAKSQPVWMNEHEVGFLDTGKLSSYNLSAQETHAIFPEADHKRAIAALFPHGGLSKAFEIADHTYVLVINVEDGQLLLAYQFDHDHPNDVVLQVIGQGEKVQVTPFDDGFVAAFQNGSPLNEPRLLMNAQMVEALSAQSGGEIDEDKLPKAVPQEGVNSLAVFGNDAKPINGIRLPFAVKEIHTVADGSKFVLVPQADPKVPQQKGIVVANPSEGGLSQITGLVAQNVSVSPDGTQIAFQSGKDIYVVPTEGGDAKNLTQGKGINSFPVWSPLLPEAKK